MSPRARRATRAVVCLLALLVVAALLAPRAQADGGVVRASAEQSGMVVTLFTTPTPLRVGEADVSVLVQDAATRATLLDAQVTVRVAPQHQDALPATVRLSHASATNKLLQAGTISLPIPGSYRLVAEARRGLGRAVVATEVTVASPLPPLLALWPFLALPPVVVGIFLVHQVLRRRLRRAPRSRSSGAARATLAATHEGSAAR